MSKHTPGPWEISGTWVQTSDEKKTPVASFNFFASTEANARLIAAAPELLEALKELTLERGMTDKARAAIAKAEGQT